MNWTILKLLFPVPGMCSLPFMTFCLEITISILCILAAVSFKPNPQNIHLQYLSYISNVGFLLWLSFISSSLLSFLFPLLLPFVFCIEWILIHVEVLIMSMMAVVWSIPHQTSAGCHCPLCKKLKVPGLSEEVKAEIKVPDSLLFSCFAKGKLGNHSTML